MQVFTNQKGELVAVGSINESEWARLQAAHKKRKAASEAKAEVDPPKVDPPKVDPPKVESKPQPPKPVTKQ